MTWPQTSTPHDLFATTRWTVVLAAGRQEAPEATRALEELCRAYWYPLYAYVRRQGHGREDAQDLTQAFFARFLSRNYLEGLSGERGKFRAFLLASLKHFLANEWDRAQRQKRGGHATHLSLDWDSADARYRLEPADEASPDRLFDRAWALALLEKVIERLRAECAAEGGLEMFNRIKDCLTADRAGIAYTEIAGELKMAEGALRVAVHRLRRRYRNLLRDEIAQTLSKPEQVEEEIQSLFSAFRV